ATGGTPPYFYELTPGFSNVPGMRVRNRCPQPGGNLCANQFPMPTSFPASTTGGYLGVFNTLGVFPTSIRVTDSVGAMFDRAFTITVNNLQMLSNQTPPRPTVGVPYDFAVIPFGLTGAATWSSSGTMPPGLSINGFG